MIKILTTIIKWWKNQELLNLKKSMKLQNYMKSNNSYINRILIFNSNYTSNNR